MSGAHQRRSVRKRVTQVIMVTNSITGEGFGRVGNLSMDGVMLIAGRPLSEEHYFQIGFTLIVPGHVPAKLEVGIQCLWCDAARTANTHWVGCKFIDISVQDQEQLKLWVDQAHD